MIKNFTLMPGSLVFNYLVLLFSGTLILWYLVLLYLIPWYLVLWYFLSGNVVRSL